jgi:hypothetical protein
LIDSELGRRAVDRLAGPAGEYRMLADLEGEAELERLERGWVSHVR